MLQQYLGWNIGETFGLDLLGRRHGGVGAAGWVTSVSRCLENPEGWEWTV
jgi:hypothetical protein